MVGFSSGTFRCVLLTPQGKLFDGKVGSLVLPAHDGMIGVLRNHMPMLCKLGMGIMEVKDIPGRGNAYFLIDGGFVRVSENFVTVLAYEVITFEDMDVKQAEKIASAEKEALLAGAFVSDQARKDTKKSGQIVKLGVLSGILPREKALYP